MVVVIVRSDKAGKRGSRDIIIFGCEKEGKLVNKDKVFGSKKRNCPFCLKATCTIKRGGWGVKVMHGSHNHELLTTLEGALYFGRLKEHEKAKVNEHVDLDGSPKRTLATLQKDDPDNVTTIGHIYRQRTSLKGPRTDIQEVMRLIDAGNYYFFVSSLVLFS